MINNSIEGHDLKDQFETTVWMFLFVGMALFFHNQTFQAKLWNISCWAFMWHYFFPMNRCICIHCIYIHIYIYCIHILYIYIIDLYTYIWHGFDLSRHQKWYSSYMWSIPTWTSVYQLLTSVEESACEGQFWHLKNLRWKDMDVSHTNHTIERNHHKFVVLFFSFFPTELLMKLSDWVRKWPFDHPNGGHLTLNPWKGSLKTSKNPTNGGFSMEKLHPTTIPKNAWPSCTAFHFRILCTLQRWQLPVGGPQFTY